MKKNLYIALLLVCLPTRALAEGPATAVPDTTAQHVQLQLDYLARGQVIDGALPKPSDPDVVPEKTVYYLENRLRLRVLYQYRSWLEVSAQLHGGAVWGSSSSLGVSLREARVAFRAPFGLFAELGRMPLAYDDERIIGANDWSMTGFTHDLLRLGYEGHGHKVHAMLAFNHTGDILNGSNYYDAAVTGIPYKSMTNLWYHYEHPAFPLGVSALFMNIGMQAGRENDPDLPPSTVYQQVFGGYAKYHPWFMTLEASGYYQRGQDVVEKQVPYRVKAWMVSAKADIHYDKRYGFVLGYDYLSGDEVPIPTFVRKGFRPVYGSRHKFLGIMEYFYESAYRGVSPGLQNAYLGVHTTPVKGLSASVNVHYLAMASDWTHTLPGRSLGTSLDIGVGYHFNNFISLTAHFDYMHGTDTLLQLKRYGSPNVFWAWLSITVNPTVLDWKK